MLSKTRGWVLSCIFCLTCCIAVAIPARAQATMPTGKDGLPAWVKTVGARRAPQQRKVFAANDAGAVGDGTTNSTKAIQQAIDACAKAGGGIGDF